jgi:RNA polymerase primary sigma factor
MKLAVIQLYTASMDPAIFDDDPIQIYLREIATVPPLTKDEEIELSQHLLADDDHAEAAGRRLVEANLAIVVSVAERSVRPGMHLLDLVQTGNEGLFIALNTFRDDPSMSFSKHAETCVSAAIARAVADAPLTH